MHGLILVERIATIAKLHGMCICTLCLHHKHPLSLPSHVWPCTPGNPLHQLLRLQHTGVAQLPVICCTAAAGSPHLFVVLVLEVLLHGVLSVLSNAAKDIRCGLGSSLKHGSKVRADLSNGLAQLTIHVRCSDNT